MRGLYWSMNSLLNSKLNPCTLYSSVYEHALQLHIIIIITIINNNLLSHTLKNCYEYRLPILQNNNKKQKTTKKSV